MSRNRSIAGIAGLLLAVLLALAFPVSGLSEIDQEGETARHELLPAGGVQRLCREETPAPAVFQAPPSHSVLPLPAPVAPKAEIRLLIHRFNE